MNTSINIENLPLIRAKFASTCSITGLQIRKGDLIFYNPINKQVIKAIKIYDCEDYTKHFHVDSFLFKIAEELFWNYMDKYGDHLELREKYFSEDAIYDKVGAIRGQIESWFEEIREAGVNFAWLHKLEFDEQFAG
jgi:hypothetical protein